MLYTSSWSTETLIVLIAVTQLRTANWKLYWRLLLVAWQVLYPISWFHIIFTYTSNLLYFHVNEHYSLHNVYSVLTNECLSSETHLMYVIFRNLVVAVRTIYLQLP
jgi:hypothetical protein